MATAAASAAASLAAYKARWVLPGSASTCSVEPATGIQLPIPLLFHKPGKNLLLFLIGWSYRVITFRL